MLKQIQTIVGLTMVIGVVQTSLFIDFNDCLVVDGSVIVISEFIASYCFSSLLNDGAPSVWVADDTFCIIDRSFGPSQQMVLYSFSAYCFLYGGSMTSDSPPRCNNLIINKL